MFLLRCHIWRQFRQPEQICVPHILSPSRKRVWSQAEDVDDQKSLTGRRREGTRLHGTPVFPEVEKPTSSLFQSRTLAPSCMTRSAQPVGANSGSVLEPFQRHCAEGRRVAHTALRKLDDLRRYEPCIRVVAQGQSQCVANGFERERHLPVHLGSLKRICSNRQRCRHSAHLRLANDALVRLVRFLYSVLKLAILLGQFFSYDEHPSRHIQVRRGFD